MKWVAKRVNMNARLRELAEAALPRLLAGAEAVVDALPPHEKGVLLHLNQRNGVYYNAPYRQDPGHVAQAYATGFLAGKLWLLFDITHRRGLYNCALDITRRLSEATKIRTFDTGFAFYYSACLGYEITKDEKMREMAFDAAETLMELYSPKAGVFYTYPSSDTPPSVRLYRPEESHETIIDVGAALNLLWWAGDFEPRYRNLALKHHKKILELGLIRNDGSTFQSLTFDPSTGAPKRFHTHQGYNDESCWVRGLTWAMISYATSYSMTHEKSFLQAARKCARYYLDNIPEDHVPFYDFCDPEIPEVARESCGASIATCALLALSEVDDGQDYEKIQYLTLMELLLNYLTPAGLLLHSSWGALYSPRTTEVIMPYGNYYFTEAIHRILRPGSRIWKSH